MLHQPPDPAPPQDDMLATLEEVAAALHCSTSRARQIEAQALRKCRDWLRDHGIRPQELRD